MRKSGAHRAYVMPRRAQQSLRSFAFSSGDKGDVDVDVPRRAGCKARVGPLWLGGAFGGGQEEQSRLESSPAGDIARDQPATKKAHTPRLHYQRAQALDTVPALVGRRKRAGV